MNQPPQAKTQWETVVKPVGEMSQAEVAAHVQSHLRKKEIELVVQQ